MTVFEPRIAFDEIEAVSEQGEETEPSEVRAAGVARPGVEVWEVEGEVDWDCFYWEGGGGERVRAVGAGGEEVVVEGTGGVAGLVLLLVLLDGGCGGEGEWGGEGAFERCDVAF